MTNLTTEINGENMKQKIGWNKDVFMPLINVWDTHDLCMKLSSLEKFKI